MTQRHLAPCPACTRHVRVTEEACPFCEARLPASLRESAPPKAPSVRLSRAALFALGALGAAGPLAVAPGCGGSTTTETPPYGIPPVPDAGDDASDATVVFAPPYGIAPIPDANFAPMYGLSPVPDAGDESTGDASEASDASDAGGASDGASDARASDAGDAGHTILPAYGIAPPYGIPPH
jgi:hypothetical protein